MVSDSLFLSNDRMRNSQYKNFVPIEALVTTQINRIMQYRSEKKTELFEEAVEALIDLLPPASEEKVLEKYHELGVVFDLSSSGKQRYVELFRFIKKHLAEENLVWNRGKSFKVGND